jgi:AbrB family looped-hinge helix DNA binding protein
METVSVSPEFEVAIPKSTREALGIRPGQRMYAMLYAARVELIPVRTMVQARGFVADIDIRLERERDRV